MWNRSRRSWPRLRLDFRFGRHARLGSAAQPLLHRRTAHRAIPADATKENSQTSLRVFDVEAFIDRIKPAVKEQGFFEQEIARRVERFGAVAHVFSTYESRHAQSDPQPFTRGINSIQLFFDTKRWWVVTIYWDSERPGLAIPAAYLPKG